MLEARIASIDEKEVIKALEEELTMRVEKRPYLWNGEWRCPYIWGKKCGAENPEGIKRCMCYVGKQGIECAINEAVEACIEEMKYWI